MSKPGHLKRITMFNDFCLFVLVVVVVGLFVLVVFSVYKHQRARPLGLFICPHFRCEYTGPLFTDHSEELSLSFSSIVGNTASDTISEKT